MKKYIIPIYYSHEGVCHKCRPLEVHAILISFQVSYIIIVNTLAMEDLDNINTTLFIPKKDIINNMGFKAKFDLMYYII